MRQLLRTVQFRIYLHIFTLSFYIDRSINHGERLRPSRRGRGPLEVASYLLRNRRDSLAFDGGLFVEELTVVYSVPLWSFQFLGGLFGFTVAFSVRP